jgi:hypothetical protein
MVRSENQKFLDDDTSFASTPTKYSFFCSSSISIFNGVYDLPPKNLIVFAICYFSIGIILPDGLNVFLETCIVLYSFVHFVHDFYFISNHL